MIFLVVVGLVVLTATNRYIGKSMLFPSALFSGLWAIFLFGLYLSGRMFYPVASDTLLFYLWGACAFTVGAIGTVLLSPILTETVAFSPPSTIRMRVINRMLDVLAVSLLLVLPIYWQRIQEIAGESSIVSNFWVAARQQLIEYAQDDGTRKISLLDNCQVLSVLIALAMYLQDDGTLGRRIRTWSAVLLSLAYDLMTAARADAVILLLSLLGVSWIRTRRVNWKQLAVICVLFVFVFTSMAILLEKGFTRRNATLLENLPTLVEGFQEYALGGIVAFDRVFHDPQKIPAVWSIDRVFVQAANKLGANFSLPSLRASFVDVGPEIDTNVYTSYFAYFPHFGLIGTSLILLFLGSVTTRVFWAAHSGDPVAQLIYGILFSGIVLSGYGEYFFMNLNFLAKALLFGYFLYKWRRLESVFRILFTSDMRRRILAPAK
jgi:oligosaccharide repeat unit polymerase